MKRLLFLSSLLIAAAAAGAAEPEKRAMKVDDLFRFQRVSEPQVSPDGKWVAYVVATVDLPGNSSFSSIWLSPTDKSDPRPLT